MPSSLSSAFKRQLVRTYLPESSALRAACSDTKSDVVVFGSDYAFQVIVNLGGACIQIRHFIPVVMVSYPFQVCTSFDSRTQTDFRNACSYFYVAVTALSLAQVLGKFGLAINIGAACWSLVMIVILL